MYDILADFDFDYCHGILYRLRVLALVFYDVLFTCYVFSVVCLFPGIYAGFFFSVHLFFASYVYSPAFMPVFSSLCICFLRRMFIPRHYMPILFPLCIFRASLREPRHLFSVPGFFLFEYHHPYKNWKHPVNDLLLAPFI